MGLNAFIQQLHDTHCSFILSKDETREIESLVLYIVKDFIPTIVKALPSNTQRFSIQEIVDAGSYFEQTKIKAPDEFDFMIVFRELSDPRTLKINKGCRSGYANVQIAKQGLWYSANRKFTPEKEFELAILGLNAYIRAAVSLVQPLERKYGTLIFKGVTVRGKPYSIFSHVQTAEFIWKRKDSFTNKSNNSFNICVDMMTCCHLSIDAVRSILPEFSMSKRELIKNGCHIVLKPCGSYGCQEKETDCRLISYTKTEAEKMRDLDENWRVVYKCAKWLLHHMNVAGVDSYKLKTTILHLSSERGHIELGTGFLALLKSLLLSASANNLRCYFNDSLNVWSISSCYTYYTKWQLLLLLKIFSGLNKMSETEFKRENLEEILNLWIHHSCLHSNDLNNIKQIRTNKLSQAAFNAQGNIVLEIVDGMGCALQKHKTLKWIPLQMKFHILVDVIKFLTSNFVANIRRKFERFLFLH